MAGLAGAYGYGLVTGGSLDAAVRISTFADGPALGPFASALIASGAVSVLVSLIGRRKADMSALRGVASLDARNSGVRTSQRVEEREEVPA